MHSVTIAVDLAKQVFELAISTTTSGRITQRKRLSTVAIHKAYGYLDMYTCLS
jgi:hypothetical protein